MGLAVLVLGLVVFIGGHALTMTRGARAAVVARIGEVPYKILYSLVSLLGIVLALVAVPLYIALVAWKVSPPLTEHVVR